jgi:hypothetical protein
MSNLEDVRIKTVPIKLDKERNLRFDLNAFAELEEAYGDIEQAMKAMEKGSIKALRAILWAGLIHEEETLTQKQIGAMIGLQDLQELAQQLSKAMQGHMPAPTEEDIKKLQLAKTEGTETKN